MRLLALCLSAGLLSCGNGIPRADSASKPTDAFVDVNGVSLQYRDWGGEGQLMVFVPSLGMTAHVFETLAPKFADRFRVVGLTRRWHGESEGVGLDFDVDSLTNDLAGFIESFTDQPAIVVGWGWATLEQMSLARSHPDLVDRLVLANGLTVPLALPEGISSPPGQFAEDTIFPSLEAAVEAWSPYFRVDRPVLATVLSASWMERDDGNYVPGPPVGTPAMARFLEVEDWSEATYAGVEVPVLAIQVRQAAYLRRDLTVRGFAIEDVSAATRWADEFDDVRRDLAAERLLSAIPDAQVVELSGVSHNFILEAPDSVAQRIADFLEGPDAKPDGQ